MARTLEKTRKQIAKKRHGAVDALHQNSRDSKRLHKASVRDERLEKLAAARSKREQPLVDRTTYFLDALRERGTVPLELSVVQDLISNFVHQNDEEYDEVKKQRRPGRPASAREDLLKMKIAALQGEQRDGFFLPDLTTESNVAILDRWEGSWSYLATVAWVKISADGKSRPSSFPPNKDK